MSDVFCPRCGEPLDIDEFHEFSQGYEWARETFFTKGCGVLFNGTSCVAASTEQAAKSTVLYELLGDDVDAIAAYSG